MAPDGSVVVAGDTGAQQQADGSVATTDSGPHPVTDAATAGPDASTQAPKDASASVGGDTGSDTEKKGCGCGSSGGAGSPLLAAAMAAMAVLGRRRRS